MFEDLKKNYEYLTTDEIMDTLIDICKENQVEYMLLDVVENDWIDEFIAVTVAEIGWKRIKLLLENIDYLTDKYFIINREGNLENLNYDYLSELIQSIEEEIFYNEM